MESTNTAPLIELFSAIQGEGANVGTRQLFIRFAGCDLRCRYCDSAHTWHPPRQCQIELTPGERDFISVPNPVTLEQLLTWCDRQNHPGLHDSISLTGGEPLLQAKFLSQLLPRLKQRTSLPLYLETGGHHPDALPPLLPYLDSIGMDIKLPSVSGECHWSAHRTFLELCHQAKVDVFCKVIISHATSDRDREQLRSLIAAIDPHIPIFLQPVTPIGTGRHTLPPDPGQVLLWQAALKEHLRIVRVIPQTHKFIQQR
ncbi:7-carboxy-7-deazaguanine synthase QueE [Candidatus Synechococcus calcipolaris G9]|uniref:7-carboxy-7-deazaguanine synthase n=1 Tax=Candidatus Synechococcus calcipolaris G9 TaxID=1497997 RepID=A0ABT6F2P2_9SYNE|nr:7-carboxy-7-deazaguanine synthase QueE [Candidatus Synechococcus calcipolaris]MDG2992053.1 7-carboxy-7-deazaguanine synthase QueE [Candidatus Synechococcus calcipolaris G9]